jgi:hypothetical protein
MSDITPFLQGDAFGPGALRAMSTALEEVCRMLQIEHNQGAREVMAARIIDLARRGERNPKQLRNRVLREAGIAHLLVDDTPTPMRRSHR